MVSIPHGFDVAFLLWLRSATEEAWEHYTPSASSAERLVAGPDWVPGTRWLSGLTLDTVSQIEKSWGIEFPASYRLFLHHLHALDRPQVVRRARAGGMLTEHMQIFCNWTSESDEIVRAFSAPLEGILFDVRVNDLWLSTWGKRPEEEHERIAVARRIAEQAPRLIPVLGHRYLVDANCGAPDLVLSVSQSDVILIAPSFRALLLYEFQRLLHLPLDVVPGENSRDALERASEIPYWGTLLQRR